MQRGIKMNNVQFLDFDDYHTEEDCKHACSKCRSKSLVCDDVEIIHTEC